MSAYKGFGDFDFDCGEDHAVVSITEPANGGLTPRLEVEFAADPQRLRDMIDGARWALEQVGGGQGEG